MTEKKFYPVKEALLLIDGVESLSTLNKWLNFIQKECNYEFHCEYIPFAVHKREGKKIYHRKTRVLSQREIDDLGECAKFISSLGRNESLKKFFDKNYGITVMDNSELYETIINECHSLLEQMKITIHELSTKLNQVDDSYQSLQSKMCHIEQKVSTLSENASGGWFRRKR